MSRISNVNNTLTISRAQASDPGKYDFGRLKINVERNNESYATRVKEITSLKDRFLRKFNNS